MIYKTTNQGCASVLRFALGDASHRRTYKRRDERIGFVFDDPDGKASEVADAYFSSEGAAVADAKKLLACDREVRETVGICINAGEWRNDE